MSGSIN